MATCQSGLLSVLYQSRLPGIVLRVSRCIMAPQYSLHGRVQHACCAKQIAICEMLEANFQCGTVCLEEYGTFGKFDDLPGRGLRTYNDFVVQTIQTPSLLGVNDDLL